MIPGLLLLALASGELFFRRAHPAKRLAWSLGGFGILAGGLGLAALSLEANPVWAVVATVVTASAAIGLGLMLMADRYTGVTWFWVPVLALLGGSYLWSGVNAVTGTLVIGYIRRHRALFQ